VIEKIASRFKTADGQEHPTWNAARKHQTGLDLAETIRAAAPSLSGAQVAGLVKAINSAWNVSRRGKVKPLGDIGVSLK
jgi:hypothetical protein